MATIAAACATAVLFGASNTRAGEKAATADEQALLKLEREWVDAETRHDVVAFQATLDDRFVATFGAGKLKNSLPSRAQMAGSQSAVEAPECMGKHERHEQDAGSEREHVSGFAQIEIADATDEQVGDGKVEQAPENIDQ